MDEDKETRVKRLTGLALLGLGSLPLIVAAAIALGTGEPLQAVRGVVTGGILVAFGLVQIARWRLAVRGSRE